MNTIQDFIVAISHRGYVIRQQIDGFYVNGINRGLTVKAAQQAIDGIIQGFTDSLTAPVDTTIHHFNEKGLLCR